MFEVLLNTLFLMNEPYDPPKPKYVFITRCAIHDIVEDAHPISYRAFYQKVGHRQLAELFSQYDWANHPRGLTLEYDDRVKYYRARWHGVHVVYAVHSAIDYIFARRDQVVKSQHAA